MRRVITGHDTTGRAVFTGDEEAPREFENPPGGLTVTEIWCSESQPRLPAPAQDPTTQPHRYFPAPGGTRFVVVRFAPAAVAEAAAKRPEAATQVETFLAQFPGLGEVLEPDHPGMHTSETVDYGVILSGEIELELDGEVTKRLRAGDTFVQNGTRHRWRNPGSVDCVLLAVVIGAERGK